MAPMTKNPTPETKLIAIDGYLYVAFDSIYSRELQEWHKDDTNKDGQCGAILMCMYDEGDCDTVSWPFKAKTPELLRRALYDARETGLIGNVQSVTLPNGKQFDF